MYLQQKNLQQQAESYVLTSQWLGLNVPLDTQYIILEKGLSTQSIALTSTVKNKETE